ncbi:MAG: T9SS type A sorting domain-containing protein [Saprospiraceae bacterium]
MKKVLPFFFLLIFPCFLFSTNNTLISNPGTMVLTPITGCNAQPATAIHNADETLDPGDILQFILHDDLSLLGTVYGVGNSPSFDFVTGMNYNTFYYISAIVGADDGTGNVDLTDPDLTISMGTPVEYFEPIFEVEEKSLCDGDDIVFNGVVYDQPGIFNVFIPGGNGCGINLELTITTEGELPIEILYYGQPAWNLLLNCWDYQVCLTGNLNEPNQKIEWKEGNTILGTTTSECFYNPGYYTITVIDTITGCVGDSSFVINADYDIPFADLNVSNLINCDNSTVTISADNVYPSPNWVDFDWYGPSGPITSNSDQIIVDEPGEYILWITNFQNGCFSQYEVEVIEDPLNIEIEFEYEKYLTCFTNFSSPLDPIVSPSSGVNYSWTGPNGFTSTILNPTVTETGTYCLEVSSVGGGCVKTECQVVNDDSMIAINSTLANCGLADGIAEVVTIDNPNLSFEWSTGETTQVIENLAAGEYFATVTGPNCMLTRTTIVEETPVCKVLISGNVYLDQVVQDCAQDAGTTGLEAKCVRIRNIQTNEKEYRYTDADGYYEFLLEPGNYELKLYQGYNLVYLCGDPYITLSLPTAGAVSSDNDYYLRLRIDRELKITANNGNVRPQFENWTTIRYCNNSGTVESGEIFFTHDAVLENPLGGTNSPIASYDAATQTASWIYSDLQPTECRKILVKMDVPATVAVGQEVTNEVEVIPNLDDIYFFNNTFTWTKEATLSFDPNDKQEFTGETNFGGAIYNPEDSILFYQIQFQNEGTDTAFNVVIKDVLDDDLDMTSIRQGVSTHDYEMKFEGSNTLIFEFKNIHLPHKAIDEEGSKGYVTFSIRLNPDLPIGTEIRNDAGIYFDFNAPIITNEVVNTIEARFYQIEGTIKTEEGEGVKDVNVLLSGDLSETILTDVLGAFSFEDIEHGGNFELNFEKNTNPWNGVTTQDIVAIRKHILGLEFLDSPYKLLAADVNNSGSITGLDMALIRSLILLNILDFPDNPSWRIIDGSYIFPNPTQPWSSPIPDFLTIENIEADRSYNMIGIKMGDVNTSAQPWNLLDADTRGRNGDLTLGVDNQEFRIGEEVVVAMRAKDFKEMTAYQFTLDFDKEQLSYTGFEKGVLETMSEQNIGTRFLEKGKLTVAWTTSEGENAKEDEPLFFLKFIAKQKGNLNEILEINSSKTIAIAYDEEENVFDVNLIFEVKNKGSILQIFPNPTSENIFININLEKTISIQLDIFNAFGQLEKTILPSTTQPKGFFQQKINVQDFSPGTYFIKMKMGEEVIARKFIVI